MCSGVWHQSCFLLPSGSSAHMGVLVWRERSIPCLCVLYVTLVSCLGILHGVQILLCSVLWEPPSRPLLTQISQFFSNFISHLNPWAL